MHSRRRSVLCPELRFCQSGCVSSDVRLVQLWGWGRHRQAVNSDGLGSWADSIEAGSVDIHRMGLLLHRLRGQCWSALGFGRTRAVTVGLREDRGNRFGHQCFLGLLFTTTK